MNTCDTCKWWGGGYDYTEASKQYPESVAFGVGIESAECTCPKCFGAPDNAIQFAGAWIEKSIDSYVQTHAKFGCIHHEPKEPKG